MACISTVDVQTRLDVQELLSQFSHALDHNEGQCWAALFTGDGVYESADGDRLEGFAALASLPARVAERGGGAWRHIINSVVIERAHTRKILSVRAYCPVIDMEQGGRITSFYDLQFTLRFAGRWRIGHALAHRVCAAPDCQVGAAAVAGAGSAVPLLH